MTSALSKVTASLVHYPHLRRRPPPPAYFAGRHHQHAVGQQRRLGRELRRRLQPGLAADDLRRRGARSPSPPARLRSSARSSPQTPLSVFIGKAGTNVNGIWRLRVVDQVLAGYGHASSAGRCSLRPAECMDGGGECPGADLALGMTAQPEPVIVGNNLTYTIAVTNNGPSYRHECRRHSPAPQRRHLRFRLLLPGKPVAQAGGVVTCNLGPMALPRPGHHDGRGPARPTTGTIDLDRQRDFRASPILTPPTTPPPSSRTSIPSPRTSPSAWLAAPNPALVGSTLTYTVSVTNNGPSAASGHHRHQRAAGQRRVPFGDGVAGLDHHRRQCGRLDDLPRLVQRRPRHGHHPGHSDRRGH